MRIVLLVFVVVAALIVLALIPFLLRGAGPSRREDEDVTHVEPREFPRPGEPSPWVDGRPVPGSADDRHRKGKP